MKQRFKIGGMTCAACAGHVEKAVNKLAGVNHAAVNLLQNSLQVDYDEGALSEGDIMRAVDRAGYSAQLADASSKTAAAVPSAQNAEEERGVRVRLIASICFLVPLLYVAMGHMAGLPMPGFLHGAHNALTFGMVQFLLTLPILYLNRSYFIGGFKALVHLSPTMDSLIALGATASVGYGIFAILMIGQGLAAQDMELVMRFSMDLYFESAATIVTLITVGKFLESRSKGRASDAINKLMQLRPPTAVVERGGKEEEIALEQVVLGDIVIIRPGSSVPVDGVVLFGDISVDEAAITGESMPVDRSVGDTLTGGTIVKVGYAKMRATRVGEMTTLSQIVRLVEEAGASKAPVARLADKVSAVFVPVVIGIAIIVLISWLLAGQGMGFALSCAIAVLVISCPCALGLATPIAIMVSTGRAAQLGILFKNAQSLETAQAIDTIVLDKTGTVTQGKPIVSEIFAARGVPEQRLLAVAASIEALSEHPLGQAIVSKAKEQDLELLQAQDFTQIPGRGIAATIEGHRLLAGNARMMQEAQIDITPFETAALLAAQRGQTPLYFALGESVLGMITLADAIKPSSRKAIDALKTKGLNIVLLTGDNQRTALAIGEELGITNVISQVLPQDKQAHVEALRTQGRKVIMVGDGINDAPALKNADIGIAIGVGTDIAMESADIVLMNDDLTAISTILDLSRRTIGNIKQNLFWAFFYNVLGIPLAAGLLYPAWGLTLSPMFASAAMSLSSLFVVLNALRLRLFGQDSALQDNDTAKIEGGKKMTKVMIVDGMTCEHCKMRVEKVLNALDGVSAVVDLDKKSATITLSKEVSDAALTAAVTDADYQVASLS